VWEISKFLVCETDKRWCVLSAFLVNFLEETDGSGRYAVKLPLKELAVFRPTCVGVPAYRSTACIRMCGSVSVSHIADSGECD